MEKYSIKWKQEQQKKHGGWAQDNKECGKKLWRWHYIQYDTEYRSRPYTSKKECTEENRK